MFQSFNDAPGGFKEEMREFIRMAIKRIWVKDKRIVAIEPRDDFKALFSAHKKVIAQAPVTAQDS